MQITIVAATKFEVLPILSFFEENEHFEQKNATSFYTNGHQIDFLITGVGMMATAYHLGIYLARQKVDFVINAGIAGSFRRDWELGKVVNVVSEILGDLGVEEKDGSFTDMFQLGLINASELPFINGKLYNTALSGFEFLPTAKGLTVNKVHGSQRSIDAVRQKYEVDVESMEGAAFMYACLNAEVSFITLRALSNYVEPRNRDTWEIELAITNLNKVLVELVGSLIG